MSGYDNEAEHTRLTGERIKLILLVEEKDKRVAELEAYVERLRKASHKFTSWAKGGMPHHPFCNFPIDDREWCNCGRSDVLEALRRVPQQSLEAHDREVRNQQRRDDAAILREKAERHRHGVSSISGAKGTALECAIIDIEATIEEE